MSAELTLYEFVTEGLRWGWISIAVLFLLTCAYLVFGTDAHYRPAEWIPFFAIGAAILLLTTAEFWISASWVLAVIEAVGIIVAAGLWAMMFVSVRWPERRFPPGLVNLLFVRR